MALDTIADYITEARVLLQDQVAPYRYTDAQLSSSLGIAVMEARRLRPDLFVGQLTVSVPDITGATPTDTAVDIDIQYRSSFVYYIVGRAQLRDEEEGDGNRSSQLLNKFIAQLLTLAA